MISSSQSISTSSITWYVSKYNKGIYKLSRFILAAFICCTIAFPRRNLCNGLDSMYIFYTDNIYLGHTYGTYYLTTT